MKIYILSESHFGNGKKLVQHLKSISGDNEVLIGDLKEISAEIVAKEKPDAVIVGGAVRMFRGAPKSKKWIKDLNNALKDIGHEIKYGAGFITHGLPTEKVQGFSKRYLGKLEAASNIKTIYPSIFTGQVHGQEGPFKDDVINNATTFMNEYLKWMK